jgi:predicted RNA-binding protein with TRAM domain
MPRRLPEKTRRVSKKKSREKRTRKYDPIPFQGVPLKAGQEIDVIIDDIGSRGDGITRIQGFLVFVPETKVGERLKVKIVSVGRKFAVAEKIK